MEINKISSTNFNGLQITKPAQKMLSDIFARNLDEANTLYQQRLANKFARKKNATFHHDEKLFDSCFASAWDKSDAYDMVTMPYWMNLTKDTLSIKVRNNNLAVNFINAEGQKSKTLQSHNENDFFGFIYNQMFKMIKNKQR